MSIASMTTWFEFGQAQLARALKQSLDLGRELGERQAAASIELMRAGLGAIPPEATAALRDLAEAQATLVGNMASQWRASAEGLARRGGACLDDLRQAQNRDEVGGVLAMYARDVGERLREDAERSGELLGAAGAAQRVLVERTLQGMIGAQPPG